MNFWDENGLSGPEEKMVDDQEWVDMMVNAQPQERRLRRFEQFDYENVHVPWYVSLLGFMGYVCAMVYALANRMVPSKESDR